jgi:hypothetical protein
MFLVLSFLCVAVQETFAVQFPPPQITVPALFSEVILEPEYQGWQLDGVGPLTYWPRSERRQERLAQMAGIEALVLTYPLTTKPVRLTQKNAKFFTGLSTSFSRDGKWMAFKYVFYPKSVVSPEDSNDPGEPIFFFLVREAPEGTPRNEFENPPSQEQVDQTVKRHGQSFDCYYSACYHREHGQAAIARVMVEMSADFGNPYAQYELGVVLQYTGDEEGARVYFKMAADQGHAECQTRYAYQLAEGIGGDVDLAGAREYYRRAAVQGHDVAELVFASMCEEGEGGEIDLPLALVFYKRAADKGSVIAQHVYANLLKDGRSGFINIEGAKKYYRMASQNGDRRATQKLEELEDELIEPVRDFSSNRVKLSRSRSSSPDRSPSEKGKKVRQ